VLNVDARVMGAALGADAEDESVDARTPTFLGLTFTSHSDRDAVRKVLIAAAILAGVQVLVFLWSVCLDHEMGALQSAFVNFICGILLPMCGYFGVKRSNKWLMGCFCGCSWCQVIGAFEVCSLLLLAIWALQDVAGDKLCSPQCLNAPIVEFAQLPGPGNITAEVILEPPPGCTKYWRKYMHKAFRKMEHDHIPPEDTMVACHEIVDKMKTSYTMTFTVLTIFTLVGCALTSFSGWYGSILYGRLNADETLVIAPAMEVESVGMIERSPQPPQE